MSHSILFLDLATTFGWCEGEPGGKAIYGFQRFAPAGSEPPAIFGGAARWMATRLQAFKPKTIVYEAPLDPRHMGPKTNMKTARVLLGLPAVIEAVAHLAGVYDIREARIDDVRLHLLGTRPKRDVAKMKVLQRLAAMGYDVKDDNAADALAGWLYACAVIAPDKAPQTTPLFAR
jgi:hypothetical protein